VALSQAITSANFTRLSAAQRHYILQCRRPEARTAYDWERLARRSLVLSRFDEALEQIVESMKLKDEFRWFERFLLQVELLLRLERVEEAEQLAREWAGEPDVETAKLVRLATVFFDANSGIVVDPLVVQALEDGTLTPIQRHHLLRMRSDVRRGAERWRFWVEALEQLSPESHTRQHEVAIMLSEITDPASAELVGQLAAKTGDTVLKHQLLLRQAELTPTLSQSVKLIWRIEGAGHLPHNKLAWASRQLNRAEQSDRVIELLELRLRRGKHVGWDVRSELRTAYLAQDRQQDALRTGKQDDPGDGPKNTQFGGGMF
jgi:hypothetical protein